MTPPPWPVIVAVAAFLAVAAVVRLARARDQIRAIERDEAWRGRWPQ